MFATGTLELLDVLLAHIDQKRQVGRVSPKTDYVTPSDVSHLSKCCLAKRHTLREFLEDELVRRKLVLVRQSISVPERLSESRGQFKDRGG